MNIKSIIEAVLYISGRDGISLEELQKYTRLDLNDLNSILEEMIVEYEKNTHRGLLLKQFGNLYKLVTKPEVYSIIAKNCNYKIKNPLNKVMIEILAIIAYNEPCTRAQIHDMKNGSDPLPIIEKLIELGLVEEAGRSESVGKPYLYQVTKLFYDTFGINSIKELPEIVLPDNNNDEEDVDFFDSNRYE